MLSVFYYKEVNFWKELHTEINFNLKKELKNAAMYALTYLDLVFIVVIEIQVIKKYSTY